MAERTCSKCGETKPETEEFFHRRGTKDRGGLRPDCRECKKAQDRHYYETNREKFRAYKRANAERIAAYMAEYMPQYYQTPNGNAAMRRAGRKWSTSPQGRLSNVMSTQRRRARERAALGMFTPDDWSACVAAFGGRCAYCGGGDPLAQEHVTPISGGGAHDRSNIVPACKPCNSRKYKTPLDVWYPRQSFYNEERLMRIVTYLESVS